MLSAMGGVATQCVKFCKRNCGAGFALPYLSKQSPGTGAMGNGTTLQLLLLAASWFTSSPQHNVYTVEFDSCNIKSVSKALSHLQGVSLDLP